MVTCNIKEIIHNLMWLRVMLRDGYVCGYVRLRVTFLFSYVQCDKNDFH